MKLKYKMKFMYIVLFTLFLFYCGRALAEEPLRSFYKTDYEPEDEVSKTLPPNVLFLLDTSTAMTFTVDGVMPNDSDGRSIDKRAEMLKDSTYGHGMRPPMFDSVETTRIEGGYLAGTDNKRVLYSDSYSRYGRDLDQSNNVIGSADCYYTSDPAKPFLLTFRNRRLAHRTDWIDGSGALVEPYLSGSNLARSVVAGGNTFEEDEMKNALDSWDAIKEYVPRNYVKNDNGYWVPASYLRPVPINVATQHLVPNDSRLYKMKLALWRITDKSNAHILARMNVGVAITFQDISIANNPISVATKNATLDANPGEREYYGATKTFIHGNAAQYVTGETSAVTLDINNARTDFSYMSQWAKRGVWVDLYRNKKPGDNMWNALSRSIMYVPFERLYVMDEDTGSINETGKLKDFRDYIRGYESYKVTNSSSVPIRAEHKPVKDEFWASSLTLLSTAIYGGRAEDADTGNKFPYHQGKRVTDNNAALKPTNELMIQFAVTPKTNAGSTTDDKVFLDPSTNWEGLPTGQAIGSVLDFFSPPDTDSDVGLDGVKFGDNTTGFFPVQGSCQANWLVVFCSGNNAIDGYSPAEAVRKLFNVTREMRGRIKNGSRWDEYKYAMDSGVRTLVVGFLPKESVNEEKEIKDIRADITEMAQAGDPIHTTTDVYVDNPDAKPEFASDVPELVKAFNSVLKRIHVDRMGSGTVSLPPVIDITTEPDNTGRDARIVFGAAYRINQLDQWTGWLSKYIVEGNRSTRQWEANENMIRNRLDRDLYTFESATNSVQIVNSILLRDEAGIPESDSGKFNDWLLDYGYDESTSDSVDAAGILGDMVNSGITVIWKPKSKFITNPDAVARDAIVYIQTNRGVLHALNYGNGNEIWGFIPPNIFQHKIKNLKYDAGIWMGDTAPTKPKSNPMVLLDGMLIANDCEYNNGARTLLSGYLGHGGNGFYTMDVTYGRNSPDFMWAIENARYDEDGPFSVDDNVKRWGAAAADGNYDYTDLGFTIVPGVYFTPANGDTDTIGVLPGGLGYKLGSDSQGKAFYFFNPANGVIRGKIDSSSGFDAPWNTSLGMGISPVIYQENNANPKRTIAFYTADSEGNILKCDVENRDIGFWRLKSILQLRTMGSSVPYEGAVVDPPDEGLAVAVPRKMILARTRNGFTWLLGGTSDLCAPGGDTYEYRKLKNREQFIFGFNVRNILEFGQVDSGITPARAINRINLATGEPFMRNMPYYSDGIPAKYGNYGQVYRHDANLGIRFGNDDYGWVLRLRPKTIEAEAEYLSADPFLMNGILHVATFIPYPGRISEETCSEVGLARLYALDPSTGLSAIVDKPAITLENVKIVGLTGNRKTNRLVLSVKELSVGAAGREILDNRNFSNALDISSNSTLFEVGIPGVNYDPYRSDPELNFEPLRPHVQYWRESFK